LTETARLLKNVRNVFTFTGRSATRVNMEVELSHGFAFSQEEGGAVTQSEVIRAYNTNLPKPGGMWNMNMNGDVLREHRFDIGLISFQSSLFSRSAYVTTRNPHTCLEQGMVAFKIQVWTSGCITSLQFAYLSFCITVFFHATVLCNLMGK